MLYCHLLPALFEPAELKGGVAVVFDVLRATTTITTALANGAEKIIAFGEVEETLAAKAHFASGTLLLGGEREGELIPGFDLDNNPFAYDATTVSGKTILFTTTNGTRAMLKCCEADRIFLGAFVNLSALVSRLRQETRPIHLVCAGTRGKITLEDSLCAGAVAAALISHGWIEESLATDDQLRLVLDLCRQRSASPKIFREALQNSFGGRNCRRLGYDTQIEFAGTPDQFALVPEFDPRSREIRFSHS